MPQLHHRDPSIIGLLGASPHISPLPESVEQITAGPPVFGSKPGLAISISSHVTPPQSPTSAKSPSGASTPTSVTSRRSRKSLHLEKGQVADMEFERPFYGLIVDGIHCHPNSVRVRTFFNRSRIFLLRFVVDPNSLPILRILTDASSSQTVSMPRRHCSSHIPEVLRHLSAMKVLDPHLQDGVYEWRDGQRYVKEGDRLYLEGTDTLAGRCGTNNWLRIPEFLLIEPLPPSVITLDKCVRNFSRFTGCSLGEAIKCATYNPAKSASVFIYRVLGNSPCLII